MTKKTLRRLFPLILTMLLAIYLTALYVKTEPKESAQNTESKSTNNEKKTRSGLILWQSLSRHLLSLK